MPLRTVCLGILVMVVAGVAEPADSGCTPVGKPIALPGIREASGVASAGGALWAINDSGKPTVFKVNASGQTTPLAVPNATVDDWEDLAVAPCPGGECFYIADIGDNRGVRTHITLYMVPVPGADAVVKPAQAVQARYPDGPHDAEALIVSRRSGAFVVTKENPARVYALGMPLNAGSTVTLRLVRSLAEKPRITGGAASPDDRWVALRSNTTLLMYSMDAFLSGGDPTRVDLTHLKEAQGEGVAFGRSGEVYLVSEAGGSGAAGTLTQIRCAFVK